MSERKKRLTDAECGVVDANATYLLERLSAEAAADLEEAREADLTVTLHDDLARMRQDWRQAREDVKRLAALLTRILTQSAPASLLDEAEKLLAEVES